MKKSILIVTLFFAVHAYSQEIPLPLKCFPLNGTDSEDIMSGQMADIYGSVYTLADRFGVKGKAMSFGKEDSYLSFSIAEDSFESKKELTFTYWVYAGKDSIQQTFWVEDRNNNLLLGMEKKGERAVLNIYHKDRQQNLLPDQQWMWYDSNFAEGDGWYFIAIAYANDGTHFYMVTPEGKMTECYSAFIPDWNLITSICIGTMGDIPAAGMDDFKVYGAALSKEQVSILYQSESQFGMGDEALINVGTNHSLYSSTWYLHCVGLQETLQYVVQNRADMTFINADAGYALSMVPDIESDLQKWMFWPVKDTAHGRIFTIANAATGMNLADTSEGVLQQVTDNSDSQKWCLSQLEKTNQVKSSIKDAANLTPLREEIYFDKAARTVRIRIAFPEVENATVKLFNSQGTLLRELYSGRTKLLEKDAWLEINGIYLVIVESDNYRINKKVFVNN